MLTNAATREMRSFSSLEENTLYVFRPEGSKSPELIGVTKGENNSSLFQPLTGTEEDKRKLLTKLSTANKDLTDDYDLVQALTSTPEDDCRISVNELKDWSIAGTATAAIQISNITKPRIIHIIKSFSIEVNVPKTLILEGYLACHRGQGSLTIAYEQEGRKKEELINFDARKKGGQEVRGYSHFSIPIKADQGKITINGYLKHQRETEKNTKDCFYFIGGLSIRPQEQDQQTCKPRTNGHPPDSTNAHLYKIKVPKFTHQSDDSLYLEWSDGEREKAFSPVKESATFQANFNHTVTITAEKEDSLICLYVNEKLAKIFKFSGPEMRLSLPPKFLKGEPAIASLTDACGAQIYDQIAISPPRLMVEEDFLIEEGRKIFPMDFSLRNSHRQESIKNNLIHGSKKDSNSLSIAIKTLDLNHKTLTLEPITFPERADQPEASIIIPAHNKVEVTYYCLCSLLLSVNKHDFEIIVIDDGSSDETCELEKIIKGITVLHNKKPLRFIECCNAGVSIAKSDYVVLLNNDTEVTSGWLDALIDGFERFDQVGLVGSRLLYPDGTLQDAGGIVWKSGDPWNYGHGQNPWDPRFSYARQVDYLSGAAMMTTKKIWDEVGGFSDYLKPMYFEDTDFSFKVREAGYKTYYIPESTIYHFEGLTSGTDTSQGYKRYQEVNRPKFKKRWSQTFSTHSPIGNQPDLEKDRNIVGRVLFIDHQMPRGDRDAGSYAALQEIKLFQSLGFKATFIPESLQDLGGYKSALQNDGVEVITAPFYLSTDSFLEARGSEFDVIYVTRYTILSSCIESIKRHCGSAKIILCNADLHFLRELRAAARTRNIELINQAKETQVNEMLMMMQADIVISYNEIEHSVIFSHSEGNIQPLACPWVVEAPKRIIDPSIKRQGLSFLGSFNHPPNKEGIEWFINTVFCHLSTNINLHVYGSGMSATDKEDLTADHVYPVGFVEDIHNAFDHHKIFIAPLLSGAGIKGKVLSAAAHGIPTILSPVAAEGTGLRNGEECLVAETVDEWEEAIHHLLNDEELWLKISEKAQKFVIDNYSFKTGREKMRRILESIDIYSSLP